MRPRGAVDLRYQNVRQNFLAKLYHSASPCADCGRPVRVSQTLRGYTTSGRVHKKVPAWFAFQGESRSRRPDMRERMEDLKLVCSTCHRSAYGRPR